MRASQYLFSTIKETPTDAEVISHQLMLRAGMIRQLASGLYAWLPTGLRTLKKVKNIIREEMSNAHAIEVFMPIVQPASLWHESQRWKQYGPELIRFLDRSNSPFVLGPTHEEVITDLIRHEVTSYKQLPLNLFQFQTKFRDELRPRFGVMRSREFLMKDAYSFHTSDHCLQVTYNAMHQAYNNIFTRIGLNFRSVSADTGTIGGNTSHEFHAIAENGEDYIVFSSDSDYAANIDLVEAIPPNHIRRPAANKKLCLVDTRSAKTIPELIQQFHVPIEKIVKTLLVHATAGSTNKLVALLVRGDHTLNEVKAEKLVQVAVPLTFATEEEIYKIVGVTSYSTLGPIKLGIPIIADRSVATMSDFAAGANIRDKHYFGINWQRDLPLPVVADIRNVIDGDASPDGQGKLLIKRGIEVGHIFQLGTKYAKAMKATVQNENGQRQILTMGCYGIGITRVVAAIVEQNHDEHGIIWPDVIAPFQIVILPINMHQSFRVQSAAENLYNTLRSKRVDVLLYDRKERPGVMFANMELIGVPHSIIISDRNLDNQEIEYKNRRSGERRILKINKIIDFLLYHLDTSSS